MELLKIITFLYLGVFSASSHQRSTTQDDSYVAAVVEYEVRADIALNVQNYVQLIQEAAEQNADIVVFPEMTLTRGTRSILVPIHSVLKEYPIPALQPSIFDEILVSVSEAARQYEIYVVINVQELLDCTNALGEYCPEQKEYLFNTNVVFDRTGAVIDRYRKINLFGEYTRTPALLPDLGIFDTDFGVTFGHFICFDLMFQVPAVQVVEKYNLTDIIFTTMWFSELPYLTAVQIQEAYAYTLNVNFLASGANNVRVGSAGSGIYTGKAGALVSIMPGVETTRLLVARVPKVPGKVIGDVPGPIYDDPSDHDNLVLISDPSLPSHISRPLVQGYQEFTLVDKDVSCLFRVRLNQTGGDAVPQFRAFVQDGSNTYSRRQLGIAACSVVACKNDTISSCVYRYSPEEKNVEIQELEIEMTTYRMQYNTTLHCDNIVYYPTSARINKFPLSPNNFTVIQSKLGDSSLVENDIEEKRRREHIIFKLNAPQDEVNAFGIWGRIFTRDVNHNKAITQEDVLRSIEIESIIYGTSEHEQDNGNKNTYNIS